VLRIAISYSYPAVCKTLCIAAFLKGTALMLDLHALRSLPQTRWIEKRIFFEITEGGQPVSCAISEAALEQVSHHSCARLADALASFAACRGQIEAAAHRKFLRRNTGSAGPVNLWADDLDDPAPAGTPMLAARLRWAEAA
jgi:hypothetical protein